MNGNSDWSVDADEAIALKPWASHGSGRVPLVAISRVRNESLLLQDTLDHVAGFADAIFIYDDASDDDTFDIAMNHPQVAGVIRNQRWRGGEQERLLSETRHRGLLLALARKTFSMEWCFCFDADERYVGPIREFVRSETMPTLNGVRVRLFDAYMTASDSEPFAKGRKLLDFRANFGPEYRDILMLWRDRPGARYEGLDSREPRIEGECETMFYCQHYGKSLSVEQWEATCQYYIDHFPFESYGKKWSERRGKALHVQSDFGNALRAWGPDLYGNAVPL
jgi:glycosyltransferase involved in cell wall biosynthesis